MEAEIFMINLCRFVFISYFCKGKKAKAMSKFVQQMNEKASKADKRRENRKLFAGFYLDLAKLCFGGLIIGEAINWHSGEISIPLLAIGVFSTASFLVLSYSILKVY